MGYVMVPVPEEHVEEAMGMILRIASRARLAEWEQTEVIAMFEDVDEPTRSVLSAVARSSNAGTTLSDHQIAESIEIPQRELLGIVRELNERAQAASRHPLILVQQDTEQLPNGRIREQRILSMDTELASLVREAERVERAANPHPLLGENG
jgi:hypothetical protein